MLSVLSDVVSSCRNHFGTSFNIVQHSCIEQFWMMLYLFGWGPYNYIKHSTERYNTSNAVNTFHSKTHYRA